MNKKLNKKLQRKEKIKVFLDYANSIEPKALAEWVVENMYEKYKGKRLVEILAAIYDAVNLDDSLYGASLLLSDQYERLASKYD